MFHRPYILYLVLCLVFISSPASSALRQDQIFMSAGYMDILEDGEGAIDLRAEIRFAQTLLDVFYPWIGIEITSDQAIMGAAGFCYDWQISDRVVVTPSLGGGIYDHGNGKNLGHRVQFRTQIELAYQLNSGSRISAALSHTSNGSMGGRNPGTEIFNIYYSLPINWFK